MDGHSLDLDISKSVIGEAGMPGFGSIAAQNIGKQNGIPLARRGASLRYLAIAVEKLAGQHTDGIACMAFDLYLRPTREVPAQVVDPRIWTQLSLTYWPDNFRHLHGRNQHRPQGFPRIFRAAGSCDFKSITP